MRVVAGVALLGVTGLVAATSASTLVANHWLYPGLLALAGAIGLVLLVTGLRRPGPPRQGRLRTALRLAAMLAAVGAAAVLLWLEPFAATDRALAAMTSDSRVTVTDTRSSVAFVPAGGADAGKAGLVLYPGAKVDPRAYAVLARGIAERGHPVVVLKCPLDIALLCGGPDPGQASPATAVWEVAGHSLGGVKASQVVDSQMLLLWAAYPVDDLSERRLIVTSISGSRDGLATPEKIDAAKGLLPEGTEYVVVAGATHASFGDYGEQPGDGTPTMRREYAEDQIIEATVTRLERRLISFLERPCRPAVTSPSWRSAGRRLSPAGPAGPPASRPPSRRRRGRREARR